jgi:hypothetical protein
MDKESKNSIGKSTEEREGLSKGDELLMRLLKVKTPIVFEPEPEMLFDSSGYGDIVDQAIKDHPGLTREEAEEMIKDLGF